MSGTSVPGSNLSEVLSEAETHVPRRRGRWILPLVIVLVLLTAAFAVAEWISRMVLTSAVDAAVMQAGVDVDGPTEVVVPGLLLPQVVTGSVGEVTVSVVDASFEGISADVEITAHDVSVLGRTAESIDLVAVTDADGVHVLFEQAAGEWEALGEAPDVVVDEPFVTLSAEVSFLGAAVPLSFDVRPSAEDGGLLLEPDAVRVAGAEIGEEALAQLPPVAASMLSAPIPVCVAGSLPTGATLTGIDVSGDEVVLSLDVDGEILVTPSLRARGYCE
ncbi:DUF2993 domain-containing protein [Microbacterium halotolerans]|uniref:LmeA family phospholipid-binding protein n=1 Tax=Microbacterium halotolerans TaxID=246613 RepID=UPI001F09F666|nr:DUF2993 domain-containing protein [Microbacterium halotolerans]